MKLLPLSDRINSNTLLFDIYKTMDDSSIYKGNKFFKVILATQRAYDIYNSFIPSINESKSKPVAIALDEVEHNRLNNKELLTEIIENSFYAKGRNKINNKDLGNYEQMELEDEVIKESNLDGDIDDNFAWSKRSVFHNLENDDLSFANDEDEDDDC
ncbi:MAG: DNA-directed RNA polymerase subunit omega [Anaplasmataceae bacterium]|nr:DNA-directed RNA polymerase subunit omega [Anaplasmataceae bacterium]